jgi:hypothetical protein
MSAIPPAYLEVITPLIGRARSILEGGERLQPIAFVGAFESRRILPVPLQAGDEDAKDQSAEHVRQVAAREKADFVFAIMEVWGLPPDRVARHRQIVERYGSVAASPYAVDQVSFALETHHGMWVAQPTIKAQGVSKRKKTFDEPRFRFFTEAAGRFTGLLANTGDKPERLQ